MKKITIYMAALFLSINIDAQNQFTNFGNVQLFTGANITFFGDFVNNSTFTANAGIIDFNGSAAQTIAGSSTTTFYNLTFSNTSTTIPQISLGASNDIIVSNILSLGSNDKVNLNGRTITLGTSVGVTGTLSYTNGFFYGGTFTRWISASSAAMGTIATNELGHFPMGTIAGDYRPLWLTYSSDLSTGGTVSVAHNPIYPSSIIAASQVDGSWAGGTTLQGVSNSTWVVSTANGYAFNGATGIIRYGGQGFGIYQLTDLDASLTASVAGTYVASTAINIPLEVNRTGLTTADLSVGNAWRIGTKNIFYSPLPIELLSFNATINNAVVDISWSTASEMNSDHFNIERSADMINITNIATVAAAGVSNTTINYYSVDEHPLTGVSYYRLKEIDHDGSGTYSNWVAINYNPLSEIKEQADVTIYPNPSKSIINIAFNYNPSANMKIDVYDIAGIRVKCNSSNLDNKGNNVFQININDLNNGIYFIHITSEESTIDRMFVKAD